MNELGYEVRKTGSHKKQQVSLLRNSLLMLKEQYSGPSS